MKPIFKRMLSGMLGAAIALGGHQLEKDVPFDALFTDTIVSDDHIKEIAKSVNTPTNIFGEMFAQYRLANPNIYTRQGDGTYKRTHNGVSYVWNESFDRCSVNGTATNASLANLYYDETHLPDGFEAGKRIDIDFSTTDPNCYLYVGFFKNGSTHVEWLNIYTDSGYAYIPNDAIGCVIRLKVDTGKSVNAIIAGLSLTKSDKYTQPLLTIIDDDGNKHFLADVIPVIEELNKPISSAVVPTRIGSNVNYMTWEQIRECSDRGAEILCHTYNHHEGSEIDSLSEDLITHEYQKGLNILLGKGFPACDIVVFSSSTGNYEKCQRSAEKVFKCGIKIGGSEVNTQDSNRYALSRYRVDYASAEGGTDWNLDDMKHWIDECVKTGGWMIWMFHTSNREYLRKVVLDSNGNPIFNPDGTPVVVAGDTSESFDRNEVGSMVPHVGDVYYIPMLKQAMQYAMSKGVDIVTAKYGLKKYFGVE